MGTKKSPLGGTVSQGGRNEALTRLDRAFAELVASGRYPSEVTYNCIWFDRNNPEEWDVPGDSVALFASGEGSILFRGQNRYEAIADKVAQAEGAWRDGVDFLVGELNAIVRPEHKARIRSILKGEE